jgi:monoamine oxidase
LAHLENWSRNPFSKGAYSSHRPGYFTSIAHNEAKPVGNLLFAGEHTSSFYEWQGTMEGAANSGLRAASEAFTLLGGR